MPSRTKSLPTPLEYVTSETGIRICLLMSVFISFPCKPGAGRWHDGHSRKADQYDKEEVRALGRKIWADALRGRKKEPPGSVNVTLPET